MASHDCSDFQQSCLILPPCLQIHINLLFDYFPPLKSFLCPLTHSHLKISSLVFLTLKLKVNFVCFSFILLSLQTHNIENLQNMHSYSSMAPLYQKSDHRPRCGFHKNNILTIITWN